MGRTRVGDGRGGSWREGQGGGGKGGQGKKGRKDREGRKGMKGRKDWELMDRMEERGWIKLLLSANINSLEPII